jgi:hypothetical protein
MGCPGTTSADRRGATHVVVGESEPGDVSHVNSATGNLIDFFIRQLARLRHVRCPLLFEANRDVRPLLHPRLNFHAEQFPREQGTRATPMSARHSFRDSRNECRRDG